MTRHDAVDLCACADASAPEPDQGQSPVSRNPQIPRLSRANAIVSNHPVAVIALIDNVSVPLPTSVTGLDAAQHWLERNFRDAGTAAFYRAERIADHPTLVSGGIYAPTTELAFLSRKHAS